MIPQSLDEEFCVAVEEISMRLGAKKGTASGELTVPGVILEGLAFWFDTAYVYVAVSKFEVGHCVVTFGQLGFLALVVIEPGFFCPVGGTD